MTKNEVVEDQRVNGELCRWDYSSNKWVPYTPKELAIMVDTLKGMLSAKRAEITRIKKDIVYRLTTIAGDYHE